MRRTARSVWFVSCMLLLTGMALSHRATAQDAKKTPEKNITHFKDWAVICPEPDNKDVPSCEAILRVTVSETGQQILRVSIFKVPESEHPLGVVILPLGFLLPQGAVLSVDGKEIGAGESMYFARGGLQQRLLQRLRRGQLPAEAALDLHGRTAAEAHYEIGRFLSYCGDRRMRSVRVIHGKGYGSRERAPVLKSRLNQWLRERPEVLAFCSARPDQGGTGAVNVLLRARR